MELEIVNGDSGGYYLKVGGVRVKGFLTEKGAKKYLADVSNGTVAKSFKDYPAARDYVLKKLKGKRRADLLSFVVNHCLTKLGDQREFFEPMLDIDVEIKEGE
ncbi:hypothetical protein FACS189444_4060 [Spirochaetia bacterium]|nr:hypothetical protein FACS189444_4060 [Spirochaetia bacterium]